MKQDWIEDFIALAEFGTFSRAAVQRSITQPAFSRRIRLLEEWLGVELIDRHRHSNPDRPGQGQPGQNQPGQPDPGTGQPRS